MGCCTSMTKKVGLPIQANMLNTSRAELLEEEKNPDLYRQSSAVENSQVLQSQAQSPMKLLDPSPNPKPASKAPSRQPSEFNLHKDMIESMRRDRTKSMTMVLENGGVIDESVYKLTKDQHEMIYIFVEERTKMMKTEIRKLNTHLSNNDKEVEELALIVEELRTCEKDIVNCLEDLRSFSVFNEEEYYKRLEKDCQFAKELITEYRTYQNGLCNFETMKQEILKILKTHHIYPEEKIAVTKSVNFESTTEAPIFQPPVENSIIEKKHESPKYEPETPQSFQITTVFEDVEGQAVEPKPMNNELEPLKEEEGDEEVKKQEGDVTSPSLPFKGLPAKHLLVDGKVTIEKTIDEGEGEGENSELRTRSNYLVHYDGVLNTQGSEESPKQKETMTKKTADFVEVIPRGQSMNIQDEEQKQETKPVKRAKKLRPPTHAPGEKKQAEDVSDSKSDLESIGVDVRFSQKDFEVSSIKSLRSKKAVEVYNVDFGAGQVELKQITKKVNRTQIMKEKVEL